ncbi:MAG: FG-GAP repeat protein, partial [Rhodanobacteraceae bacterium]|nr:FG-GAP repeat protein [Rhodanobacteraceae bacterium]
MKKPLLLAAALLLMLDTPIAQAQTTSIRTIRGCCGFGWALSPLRDIDGDGITDAIVGQNGNGHVFVYSGRSGQQLHDFSLPGSDLGNAVADAGDVDADGMHDIVAGAVNFAAGLIRVYSGRTGAQLLAVDAPAGSSGFGQSVAGVGDVNGDGRADLLVGAHLGLGRAFVISGADGAVLRTLSSVDNRGFGAGVAKLRDVSGDGIAELLVSSMNDARLLVYSGADGSLLRTLNGDADSARFGEFFVADAGDVDADGKHDIYVGDYAAAGGRGAAYVFSGADGHRLHKFTGATNEGFGTGRGAGDVDGDGHADLIIGGGTFSPPGVIQGGRATVYSGATGAVLAVFTGSEARANFGFDAVGIGDVNGDRRPDFLISSSTGNRVDIIAGTSAPPAVAGFDIGAPITGIWYDPAQSGHGIFIEVLAGQQILAWWFTFDAQGKQAWFGGLGSYSGNRALINVTQTRGGRFIPNFNAANISNPSWGTLTFTFTGCNSGRVEFESDLGFGAGTMALTRLSQPLGLACP